jgi:LysM repeat protein
MISGKLKKLTITAYKDDTFSEPIGDGKFTSLLNPENYAFNYKIEYSEAQAIGTSAAQPKFIRTLPQDLNLEFLFDQTGVMNGITNPMGDGIIDEIEQFKRIIFDYNGEQHKPNYVMIGWGSLLFKGVLADMSLEFKLFAPDGTPLRAIAKTSFKGSVEDNLRVAKENNSSPDLTHIRIVQDGDTLPLMAFRIYGDSKYYLQVAAANNLTNFRKLRTGQELFFPPIEKTT